MAVNLTPQYHRAEEEFRRASTPEEELRWLEEMYKELPKHKASEKLQSELKQKISRLKKEVSTKKPAKAPSFKIPRQGAGTGVLLGGPNAGKSSLLAALTRATPEVAEYPFTTRAPLPGMMAWEDVYVQLIDCPPITADFYEPFLHGLIRSADLAVLVVDLGSDDGIEGCQELWERVSQTKSQLGRQSRLDEEDIGLSYTATLLVPSKIDLPQAAERLELLHELLPLDLPEYVVSSTEATGLDDLKRAIYETLGVIRIYTKNPRQKEPDYEKPFTLREGCTLFDLAGLVHKDLQQNLKYARLWGHGVHDGETIKADHVLHDRDVVEIHT